MRLLRGWPIAVAAALVLCTVAPVWASGPAKPGRGTPADAKAMLAKVAAHLKSVDRKQALFDFTARKRPFFDRDLYVVCVDVHLVVVAHGGFPTYVGSGQFFKDASGKMMAPVIWDAATKGNGTVRYSIRDDESNNAVDRKIGFFQRINDDVCGVVAHAS
jgi:hypothetical protein